MAGAAHRCWIATCRTRRWPHVLDIGLDLVPSGRACSRHETEDDMESGRGSHRITAAFAVVLAMGVAPILGAQQPPGGASQAPAGAQGRGGGPAPAGAQGGGRGGAPYTPAAGAKDLRSVLFNWMWHQGMLKGADERDMVAMLEYQAKGGTIQVDGQPCTLSRFRESTNYLRSEG